MYTFQSLNCVYVARPRIIQDGNGFELALVTQGHQIYLPWWDTYLAPIPYFVTDMLQTSSTVTTPSVECRTNMRGLTAELSVEAMMMDESKKFENELKKPLLRNDKKGMDILLAESDKVNQK
ncbi:hypothetical protein M0R45_036541 [Rubus argutus]|uniref:Uncharacterized protein n=1 Tax=Rubus argutus TaxID=59490 RepID=A0AAW1VXF3_RUBAR